MNMLLVLGCYDELHIQQHKSSIKISFEAKCDSVSAELDISATILQFTFHKIVHVDYNLEVHVDFTCQDQMNFDPNCDLAIKNIQTPVLANVQISHLDGSQLEVQTIQLNKRLNYNWMRITAITGGAVIILFFLITFICLCCLCSKKQNKLSQKKQNYQIQMQPQQLNNIQMQQQAPQFTQIAMPIMPLGTQV
ncbi:Hypothetical_protein [Hexamita inflata]|uniref:Hypothetical_protein n=1 Tax=Hexamita inflata TaxID=28002 RepID=A0AA86PBT4_9EUKA|nr:Hypothetical protein HINF_LOCUS21489 [Hexamita inflata]CAI9933845.1 Hypothetical protein HINF_LOCUS21490 [Hexamita inflata]